MFHRWSLTLLNLTLFLHAVIGSTSPVLQNTSEHLSKAADTPSRKEVTSKAAGETSRPNWMQYASVTRCGRNHAEARSRDQRTRVIGSSCQGGRRTRTGRACRHVGGRRSLAMMDAKRAAELYRKASEAGRISAKANLALIHANDKTKESAARKIASECFADLKKLADQGDAKALVPVGDCYRLGYGTTADASAAFNTMKRRQAWQHRSDESYCACYEKDLASQKMKRRLTQVARQVQLKATRLHSLLWRNATVPEMSSRRINRLLTNCACRRLSAECLRQ